MGAIVTSPSLLIALQALVVKAKGKKENLRSLSVNSFLLLSVLLPLLRFEHSLSQTLIDDQDDHYGI